MTLTYRRDISRPLHATEADGNIDHLVALIQGLIDNPPTAAEVSSVTQDGRAVTFHYSNGDTFDITLPIIMPAWRGAWQTATMYAAFDLFYVDLQGVFVVLQPHVSAAEFDPDESNTAGEFYQQILGPFEPATLLSQLDDVEAFTTTFRHSGILRWSVDEQKWKTEQAVKTTYIGGTTHTLAHADIARKLRCGHASGCTITFPRNFDDDPSPFEFDQVVHFRQVGGPLSFVGESGTGGDVTIVGIDGFLNSTDRAGAEVTAQYVDDDTWELTGLLELDV